MKAKKAIALTKEAADLLPEKLIDADYMNNKSMMYGAGFVAAISIVNKLVDMEEDDEELTPDNIADMTVASCIVTAHISNLADIISVIAGTEKQDED